MQNSQFTTPILLVIFNRPEYTKLVFEEIRKQRPTTLFIAADGPRTPSEEAVCRETRAIVGNIDWPCDVKTLFRETNFGFAQAEKLAFDWFFENVEEGIILEDDQLPHPSFFRFMAEMLEKYRDNEKVMMITGDNFLQEFQTENSYFFSKYYPIWGWATWRRAWRKYDFDMKGWGDLENKKRLKTLYPEKYMLRHMTKMFDDVYINKNTWDTQWVYACIISNSLCIVPSKNLISNIGIYGTHQGGFNQNLPVFNLYEKPLNHPPQITENTTYDSLLYQRNFCPQPGSFFKNIKWKIIGFLATKRIVKKLYRYAIKVRIALFGYGLLENVNNAKHNKNCLLMYIIEPFKNKKISFGHQSYYQSRELAKIIGEFGYNVDVIQFNDKRAKLTKKYDLVFDLHPGMNMVYQNHLNPGAKRVAYITGSNPLFTNDAETKRINDIYARKKVKLNKRRSVEPFKNEYLKSFDCMLLMGNQNTLETYKKETPYIVHLIPNTGYEFLANHDHSSRSPKKFLFLAGSGQVHKGLDLLLEVFAKNPDLHLYVCSNFKSEEDFCGLYKRELYETNNIHPVGFIDVDSFAFVEMAKQCTYIISPSCAEGQSGSVLVGMSSGLIPIISKENGIDEEGAHILHDCLPETIEGIIREYSKKPAEWREKEAENAIKIIHDKYSPKNFSNSIKEAMSALLHE